MPDPSIGISEMNLYGYSNSDVMLPLAMDRAIEIFDDDHTIYLLHPDDSESMAFDRDEILSHDGLYGIERQEWEARLDFEALAESARNSEGSCEAKLLYSSGDRFGICQIPSGIDEARNSRFASMRELEAHGLSVDRANYELVYTAPFSEKMEALANRDATLNEIYAKFNAEYPADYNGRSVSISDVIVLNLNGEASSHFVDSVDFVALDGFLGEETHRAAVVEMPAQDKESDKSDTYSQVGNSLNDKPPAAPKTKPTLAERLAEGRRKSEQHGQNGDNKAKKREIDE